MRCSAQQNEILKPEIGIVGNLADDSLLNNSGYHYLVESASKLFSPMNVDDQQFENILRRINKLQVKLYALNIFIPGELKLVGPAVNEQAILRYASKVFERCKRAHVNLIVWGSGGARRIPEGFDPIKARAQFIVIAKKVAMLASEYNIMLALENLNSRETNFINTFDEAFEIVKAVDHPHLQLCVDIYHMMVEHEPADVITKTKAFTIHCDIAESNGRNPPGTTDEDFRSYLRALKEINYNGKIMIESQWKDLSYQAAPARIFLQKQIDDVYEH
jgi:sugar phosphate isomerase/epimerase